MSDAKKSNATELVRAREGSAGMWRIWRNVQGKRRRVLKVNYNLEKKGQTRVAARTAASVVVALSGYRAHPGVLSLLDVSEHNWHFDPAISILD